jgi:hypothetical protein
MIGGILDGHHLVLSVRTIEPVALSRRSGLPEDRQTWENVAGSLTRRVEQGFNSRQNPDSSVPTHARQLSLPQKKHVRLLESILF